MSHCTVKFAKENKGDILPESDALIKDISLRLFSEETTPPPSPFNKVGILKNWIILAGGNAAIGDLLMPDDLRYIISIEGGTRNSFEPYFAQAWAIFCSLREEKRKGKAQKLHFYLKKGQTYKGRWAFKSVCPAMGSNGSLGTETGLGDITLVGFAILSLIFGQKS